MDFISKNEYQASLADISSALEIPKSTACNIVHTLTDLELLELADEKLMTYKIGYRSYAIGVGYKMHNDMFGTVRKELDRLAQEAKIAAGFYIYKEETLRLLDMQFSDRSAYPNYAIGSEWQVEDIPPGIVCLTDKSDELIRFIAVRKGIDADSFAESVSFAKQAGYSKGEFSQQLICYSFPCTDDEGHCRGALCIYELSSKITEEREDQIVELGKHFAANIARCL